jgi:hypothetical protein
MSANPSANETNRNEFHGTQQDRSPCYVGHFESEHSSSNRIRAHGMQGVRGSNPLTSTHVVRLYIA